MKLLKRTYLYASLWLIPVFVIGSIFSFYIIKYVIYEETDEHLTYEMDRLVAYHDAFNDLPEYHKVDDIITGLKLDKPLFKDTLILEPRDNEMIPHRELHFSVYNNGQYYTLVLRQILPGNDDIIEGSLLMVSGLLMFISLVLVLMLTFISEKVWSPFYKTLRTLSKYKITDPIPSLRRSNIDEFNTLNTTIEELLKKITDDYKRTKEFNENASHELQTHLSIIRLNADKLLSETEHTTNQTEYIQHIIQASAKLANTQTSLLLLSKIGNLEYQKNIEVNLAMVITDALPIFTEAMDLRNITLYRKLEDCPLNIDKGLSEILVNNLLKNAIKHNIQDGQISIELGPKQLIVENTGFKQSEDTANLFERYSTGSMGDIGLGLAIVKQICDIYKYKISYTVEESTHQIQIFFSR